MRKIRREDIYMLLSYEEFKERVMNEFIDYLPEKYSDCMLELHQVPKLNEVLTGIAIKPKKPCKSFIATTFYMARPYAPDKEYGTFEQTMAARDV